MFINQSLQIPWWARNPHLQTLLPFFFCGVLGECQRQRLEMDDGDFIDLDWQHTGKTHEQVIVILCGLEGSGQSHYVKRLLVWCRSAGLSAVLVHHRGCSGEINRLARSYHSGNTKDLAFSLSHIESQYPLAKIWAVGYSLGGNILAKYLGEYGEKSLVARGVIISAPLNLLACAERLEKGFSRLYQRFLIKELKQKTQQKLTNVKLNGAIPVTLKQLNQLNTFKEFDDRLTAPLHGFKNVYDYYSRASGINFLNFIKKPTLIIHAKDDPFMTEDVIPSKALLSPHVVYELHCHGGHIGFINGGVPWCPSYYLEPRIIEFLSIDPEHA